MANDAKSTCDDEIVITGLSGRYPNSDNFREFEHNLYNKIDMIDGDSDIRWKNVYPNVPHRFGKIRHLEKFDAPFFVILKRIADFLDPQCRIILEKSYEAILDAGIAPKTLVGSNTAVLVGCCYSDAQQEFMYDAPRNEGLDFRGGALLNLSNRVSFALGLRGPSFTLDSACSSAITALDIAVKYMRSGACETALVAGSNLILHPNNSLQYGEFGVLNQDGICSPFDKNASGFVRSDAIVVIFLQKSKDAKRIYARIVNSASDHDGFKKEGYTFPACAGQIHLYSKFYKELNFDPSQINFVETHCTATVMGDPEEARALDEVFCKNRTEPLPVGSVKSNMGHGEAASGLCSISKMILTFENKSIPPNINFSEPRVDIPVLKEGRIRVVTDAEEFKGHFAAMNSLGIGGAKVHVLLEGNRKDKVNMGIPVDDLPRLATWTGRTEEAVHSIFDDVATRPLDAEYIALLQSCQSNTSYENIYRGYGIFKHDSVKNKAVCISRDVHHFNADKRPIVFVYSGMGSQWNTMGKHLMKVPIFAQAIDKCHNILAPKGLDLKWILTSDDETIFDNILHSFVGIAAIQIGLTDILNAVGLKPDYIIGHSVGELGCAYGDGCFTAEEMILSSYSRGMVSNETEKIFGAMAAVGEGYEIMKNIVPSEIEVACRNGPDSSTISGPAEKVKSFVAELKAKNIFAKEVNVANIAYHSKHIAKMGPVLRSRLLEVIKTPKKRSPKWLSTSAPYEEWVNSETQYSSAGYHTNNLLCPVLFEDTCKHLPKNILTVEIAPSGLLKSILKRTFPDGVQVSLTNRGKVDGAVLLMEALGQLFQNGIDIDISKLYPEVQFPVSRGTPTISSLIKWDYRDNYYVPYFNSFDSFNRRTIYFIPRDKKIEFVQGHMVDGRVLYPATGFIFLIWETFGMMVGVHYSKLAIEIEDLQLLQAVFLKPNEEVRLQIVIHKGSGRFEMTRDKSIIISGFVRTAESVKMRNISIDDKKDSFYLSEKDFYKELRIRGYNYKDAFKSIVEARSDGLHARAKWTSNWTTFLDSMLQILVMGFDSRDLLLPTGVRRMLIDPKQHEELFGSDEKIVDIIRCPILNIIQSGGVEIQGVNANFVNRRKPAGCPVLESYKFVPHFPSPVLSEIDVAKFCVQLSLENFPLRHVRTVELDTDNGSEPLSDFFHLALEDMPLVKSEAVYLSDRKLQLKYSLLQNDELSSFSNCSFIITSNGMLDNEHLKEVSEAVGSNGYIISRESLDFQGCKLPQNFSVIAALKTESENIFMIKVTIEDYKIPSTVVRVTSKNFDWIETLQEAIRNGPVIAYSERDGQSGILGLINCIRREPGGEEVTCIFIQDKKAPKFSVGDPFYQEQLKLGLGINVLQNSRWGSYRHLSIKQNVVSAPRTGHCYVNCLVSGDLSSMTWIDAPPKNVMSDKYVQIQYASLNFRDAMLASGKLVEDVDRFQKQQIFGFEYAGVLRNGRRVMGMDRAGALATHIEAKDYLFWDVPDQWTLEMSATVPIVYATVYTAFFINTKLEKGKSILIHAGTGGVGIAAIRVAIAYGLEVFTTCSTQEKRDYLLSEFPVLKDENIGYSRDTSFEDMVMKNTNGKGVDYVLNSLSEEKLQASLRCLGNKGVFLEIGKFDLLRDTKLGMRMFLKQINFQNIQLDFMMSGVSDELKNLHSLISNDIKAGIIKPLKTTVFEACEVEKAIRYLASARHIGKVILKVRKNELDKETLPISVVPRVYCNSNLSYIIPGGLGGFGLELADWLIIRGCRKLVLSSSRGIKTSYQLFRIKHWKSYGVNVVVCTSNISIKSGCEQLIREGIKLGPVGGIFNLAVILRDGIFDNQDAEKFAESLGPKAVATKHLDEISRVLCPNLHYFVVFSSASCGRGNAGQSNYGMANSVMERIVEQRYRDGLPAKAVQFGAVGEVGIVAEMQQDNLDMEIVGTLTQRISSCLDVLDTLLNIEDPITASMVVAEKRQDSNRGKNVVEAVMNIIGINDIKMVSTTSTLAELGMDSLMTVEVQQFLQREYKLDLSSQELRSMTLFNIEKRCHGEEGKMIDVKNTISLKQLIKSLGDEETSEKLILNLENDAVEKDNVKALIVPGVEAISSETYRNIAKQLIYPTYILQYANVMDAESIEDITNRVIKDVEKIYSNDDHFMIIGHSVGSLLALNLAKRLESQGRVGKVLLIDGSPDMFESLAKVLLPAKFTSDDLQNMLMTTAIDVVFPAQRDELLAKINAEDALIMKYMKFLEVMQEGGIYSSGYIQKMFMSTLSRLKIIQSLNRLEDKIFSLKATTITLLKPTIATVKDLDEFYGLRAYTSSKIQVHHVEGDHSGVLENPELSKILNGAGA